MATQVSQKTTTRESAGGNTVTEKVTKTTTETVVRSGETTIIDGATTGMKPRHNLLAEKQQYSSTTATSGGGMYLDEYQSAITGRESFPANTFVRGMSSRTSMQGGGDRTLKITSEMGMSATGTGISAKMGADAASDIFKSREKEKKEMQSLNDRLGNFLKRVKELEVQNRQLVEELEALRGSWGKDTVGIKEKFIAELKLLRNKIDEIALEKAKIEVDVARKQVDVSDARNRYEEAVELRQYNKDKITSYTNQLSAAEDELQQLNNQLKGLNGEIQYYQNNDDIRIEIQKFIDELDEETIRRLDNQNKAQTLLEELEFMRKVHEQEVRELERLISNESSASTKDYFKNELAMAIRDIRTEYDHISRRGKADMESWYKLKVQEVEKASKPAVAGRATVEESKRLREQLGTFRDKIAEMERSNATLERQIQELMRQLEDEQRQYEEELYTRDRQVRKMREESQQLMYELQALMDTKQSLDTEIAIYRRMLEGEESRSGLATVIKNIVEKRTTTETDKFSKSGGEIRQKTRFQRAAKGNVAFVDKNVDQKVITLENTSVTKAEDMDGWKLSRKCDGGKELTFTFPKGYNLGPGKQVKVFCKGIAGAGAESLIFEGATSWGTGSRIETVLRNAKGEERATHTQSVEQEMS